MSMLKLLSTEQVLGLINDLSKNTSMETTTTLNNLFLELCRINIHFPAIKLLLQDSRIDSSMGMRIAIIHDRFELSELLLQDPKTDPNQCIGSGSSLLEYASEYNFFKIVELLLKNENINPCTRFNYSLRVASKNGHIEAVKLLLKHNKVDPTDLNNEAILSALKKNHIEIVKLLIPRIDMSKITSLRILRLAKELEVEKTLQSQLTNKINNYLNPIGATGATNVLGSIGDIATTSTNLNGEVAIIASIVDKVDSNDTNVEVSTVNITPENKFITNFIAYCPAKTPFEIHYVDNILTVKYKV